jgi:hypothetical protein
MVLVVLVGERNALLFLAFYDHVTKPVPEQFASVWSGNMMRFSSPPFALICVSTTLGVEVLYPTKAFIGMQSMISNDWFTLITR